MNGHKFIQRQFYQPILCALCQEFLLTGEGYQCEDCRYACHKKCYPKVVTKCVSKSNAETVSWAAALCRRERDFAETRRLFWASPPQEGDEEKINHRIPHRFQTLTNVSANWCCHCGYMLPLGRKNAKKCSGGSLSGMLLPTRLLG
jgi:classical protein kinase C/novel protein kinase C epsilon type